MKFQRILDLIRHCMVRLNSLVATILDQYWSILAQYRTNIFILVQYWTNIGQLFFASLLGLIVS
jgi:hypothetical protein